MNGRLALRKKNLVTSHRAAFLIFCACLFIPFLHAAGDDAARKAEINLAGTDLHALPLNAGNITTSGPKLNYAYVCNMGPIQQGRGGAQNGGPWSHSDGTFDAAAKPHVDGSVDWPNHKLSISAEGDRRLIFTNDLPDVPTGIFPIEPGTQAYKYDTNPNSIQPQNLSFTISARPKSADVPSCMPPGGPIGVLLTGAELYNALDAGGRNAVAYEVQDHCWGHPQRSGSYHYHSLSPCMDLGDKDGTSPMLGYALDGFGIYGPYENGKLLTNKDLGECHGKISAISWEGKSVVMYHYVANFEYPFTVGCFRGTPAHLRPEGPPPFGGPGRNRFPPPPDR